MPETDTASPWMTRKEAADHLRVGVRTIDRYADRGDLVRHRVEGRRQSVRFARAAVLALVAEDASTQ